MRKCRIKGARVLRPIDVLDHYIPYSLNKVSKLQIIVIIAQTIPSLITRIDMVIDEKINLRIFNTWVK
jgi:hypothetical protein